MHEASREIATGMSPDDLKSSPQHFASMRCAGNGKHPVLRTLTIALTKQVNAFNSALSILYRCLPASYTS